MKPPETHLLLNFWIDDASSQIAVSHIPEPYDEDTLDLLQDLTAEWASQFLTKLQSALNAKYGARYFTLSVALEKGPASVIVIETSGAK